MTALVKKPGSPSLACPVTVGGNAKRIILTVHVLGTRVDIGLTPEDLVGLMETYGEISRAESEPPVVVRIEE